MPPIPRTPRSGRIATDGRVATRRRCSSWGFVVLRRGSDLNPRLRCSPPAALLARGIGRHISSGGCLPSPAPPEADDLRASGPSGRLASGRRRFGWVGPEPRFDCRDLRRAPFKMCVYEPSISSLRETGTKGCNANRPLTQTVRGATVRDGFKSSSADEQTVRRRQASASGGAGDVAGIPRSNSDALKRERGAQREPAPQARVQPEIRREPKNPTTKIVVTSHVPVRSNPVRFWGVRGMRGIPRSNSDALKRERGAQPEASTASEGSAPNHAKEQQNLTTNVPSRRTSRLWPGRHTRKRRRQKNRITRLPVAPPYPTV